MDITLQYGEGDSVDLDPTDAATMAALIRIADVQAELRALRDALVHPGAGSEQVLAAAYTMNDLADALMAERFALEAAAGAAMLADKAARR